MNCFTERQIEDALDSSDELLTHQFEQHIEDCEGCRHRLEMIVGSESEWTSACDILEKITSELHSVPTSVEPRYESTFLYKLNLDSENSNPDQRKDQETAARLERELSTDKSLESPRHPENLGRIGRYEIERPIGRGGMGVVFKGFDAELNRPVAIKILAPHLADHGTARQRFTREAKAAAAVVHDNVVPIFDIHSDSDRPYLVMPFVNGVSLQDYVDQKGQIGIKDILRVALQIASGLSAAHAQGLIHRDIKPTNILLENGLNRVQITDFGLARAVDDAAMTYSGMIAGTPHYMSPEQSQGESLDHRSDLFSLGCVMYFMATGRTLYRGDGPYSVLAQVPKGQYTAVREINPKIPAFVEDIIDKLLETKRQNRFQTAAQVGHHIERALAYLHQPTSQKLPQRIWSSKKKKNVRRLAIGSISVLGLIIGSISLPLAMGWFRTTDVPKESVPSVVSIEELDSDLNRIENEIWELEQQLQIPDEMTAYGESTLSQELSRLQQELDFSQSNPSTQQQEQNGNGIPNLPDPVKSPGFSESFNANPPTNRSADQNTPENIDDINHLPKSSNQNLPN